MEEILRLEREIERLQRQRGEGVSLVGAGSASVAGAELQLRRDAEILRLEKEASRVATEFLEMLDFGGLEPSLSSEENLPEAAERSSSAAAPLAQHDDEEELDESLHGDGDGDGCPTKEEEEEEEEAGVILEEEEVGVILEAPQG